jgi:2-isopropylmalate synthase
VIQSVTDGEGGEIEPDRMGELFRAEYLNRTAPLALNSVHTSSAAGARDALDVGVFVHGVHRLLSGSGNGPIDAFVNALGTVGFETRVLDYAEHAMSSGTDASAAAYVECSVGGEIYWGVGTDSNILTASLKAVVSAVNRAAGRPREPS